MFHVIGVLAGITVSVYVFFLLGRLTQFYAEILPWKNSSKCHTPIKLLLTTAVGVACFDIWSATAMVALHLVVVFVLTDLFNLFFRLLRHKSHPGWQRIYRSGAIPLMLFACLMLYGSININRVVQTEYSIFTDKAIREEGYCVAFLSDIHYGTVQEKSVLQSTIAKINAQNPDVVILGGDIVEEGTSKEDMREVFYQLGCLKASQGIYFAYGNHDRQIDVDTRTYTDEELIAAIEGNGIIILEDDTQLLDGELLLIGRADVGWDLNGSRKEISELIPEGQDNLFLLTIDHQPLEVEENGLAGVDLMLSGHTHAGQLFPVGYLTELAGGENYGLYQKNGCLSIVSSGFGGWGYGIRTQAHCEYVIVNVFPNAR